MPIIKMEFIIIEYNEIVVVPIIVNIFDENTNDTKEPKSSQLN